MSDPKTRRGAEEMAEAEQRQATQHDTWADTAVWDHQRDELERVADRHRAEAARLRALLLTLGES